MKPIYLSLLALTGALLVVRGQASPNGGEKFRTDINPALLYYQAFLLAPEPISEEDRAYLASKKGKEQNGYDLKTRSEYAAGAGERAKAGARGGASGGGMQVLNRRRA